ncbi:hypothetical protein OG609_02150 [Streptomyces sp. NBC_01224]|uniref:hypothetical protein n=1 Tax=unclassified Streptomyces TaxID=2593676 RepID=UPI002E0FB580|nr:hypothetical protein OG609_02150 [Streptomyces sp. NBC_01224]
MQHPVQETLAHPVQRVTTAVERVPGADRVKGIVDGVLDSVGIVSPHARRVAAYTGAGLLGVAGVVEWPVAMAGAAVVWLTQPRPKDVATAPAAGEARTEGSQAKRAGRPAKAQTTARPAKTRSAKASTTSKTAKKRPAKSSTASGTAKTRPAKASTGSGTAKARASKRAATSATGTTRAKAHGRKKP